MPEMNSNYTVFYSWQSDETSATNGRTNRNLIHDALEKAAKRLRREDLTLIDVDRDTAGVGGAPDIAATILRKIDGSDGFVGDVTFVNPDADSRLCPNPNVMLELGYALKSLGDERVTLVFNEASGALAQLPFDLRGRRVTPYRLHRDAEDEQRKTARQDLADRLFIALRSLVETLDAEREEAANAKRAEVASANKLRIQEAQTALAEWASRSRSRFEETFHEMTGQGIDDYYPHGTQEVAYAVVTAEPIQLGYSDRIEALKLAELNLTGWPAWATLHDAGRPEFRPRPRKRQLERVVIDPGDPFVSDFWRADGAGRLYLARGYREDRGPQRGRIIDFDQPIRNVSEALAHAMRFCKVITEEDAIIMFRFQFAGLGARVYGSMSPSIHVTPRRMLDDEFEEEYVATLSELSTELPRITFDILKPFYELFDYYQLNEQRVASVVEEHLNRRSQ